MTAWPWLVLAALTALNALYVAAEFSVVAVPRAALAERARAGHGRSQGLLAIVEDPALLDRYIAACQIGITLTSLVSGAFGQATIALELAPILERAFHLSPATATSTAALSMLVVLTALQMVLGELVPKSLALEMPEKTALATYVPTRLSASLYRPFISLLNGSGFLLLKPFGVSPGGHQHVHSPEEIALMLSESRRGGALSDEAHRRLTRGLTLGERTVREIMTPRTEIFALDAALAMDDVIARVIESPYSRIPVYAGTLDHILGTLDTKPFVGVYAASKGALPPLAQLLRPIPFVPEHLAADKLVPFLKERHSSKAIVVDEFGGVAGIVSVDDVLAQLFGDVGDELTTPEPGPVRLPDGGLRLPGTYPLEDADAWLRDLWYGIAPTVGGHLLTRLGRLPEQGERVVVDDVEVHVDERTRTAVAYVTVRPARSGRRA